MNNKFPSLSLHELPPEVASLLQSLDVHPHLLAHLVLVHDVAVQLVEGVEQTWPDLEFDAEAVLFGAATHDIGKVHHPHEMLGPGQAHHAAGVELLESHGISPQRARFARTHAGWQAEEQLQIEDLLVALADVIWAGGRDRELEDAMLRRVSSADESALWRAYMELDDILTELAADAELRLIWQTQFAPTEQT
jgi:hypothetical protein